ncbi:MAG: LrgB family protein [Victivallaceae bacterium]|nr:LrgB family protein [Victivallaceae bacterium]
MNSIFENSAFFGVVISLCAYGAGVALQKRFACDWLNPLLISVLLTILFLRVWRIDYQTYSNGAELLGWLLTPATVCLAIPLYEKFGLLRRYWKAIGAGILAGVLTGAASVAVCAMFFHLGHEQYVTLLPKSITTGIGIGLAEELGGSVAITVAAIILTGIFGNIFAQQVCRVFKISDPIARGVAIGTSSHAIGTAKAMEMGPVEGAISSLSLVVAGLLTVAGASLLSRWI